MADPFAPVLERLVAAIDAGFEPPPLDADVAARVLGPAGAPGTPHRRLLERSNGAYLFGRALHLFGACRVPGWHSLEAWNSPSLWRDAYAGHAEGLTFFAEDAFGDQYAYSGRGGEVVAFAAETGRVETAAPHFVAWLEGLLAAPGAVLPIKVLDEERAGGRELQPGSHLYAWPPLCTRESQTDGVTIGHVDAVEAMRFRGELARQLRDLPAGTQVRIDIHE